MPPGRSKNICHQCRSRKVRCSGAPGPCVNCERLDYPCSFQAESSVARRRGALACSWCRSQKSRCTGGQPCAGCNARGQECIYPEPKRKDKFSSLVSPRSDVAPDMNDPVSYDESQKSATSPDDDPSGAQIMAFGQLRDSQEVESTTSSSVLHPDIPVYEQLHLVVEFFLYVYPWPSFSFLGEESTKKKCLDGELDEPLLLAICAYTALRLRHPTYGPSFTSAWVQRAEAIVWEDIENPTMTSIQALLLVTHYRIEMGQFQKAFMLTSLVGRAVTALQLNYERTERDAATQELRRRLTWAVMLLDLRFSIGLPEYEVCPYEVIYLKLPGRDLSEKPADDPEDADELLLAAMIRELTMRRDIMRLSRQISLRGEPMPQLVSLIADFEASLAGFGLKPYSLETLKGYQRSRWLPRYAFVHLAWNQCHCDLYRLFLPGYREAAPEPVLKVIPEDYVGKAAQLCLGHAQTIINILRDLTSMNPDWKIVDLEFGICGYHASRLRLFLASKGIGGTLQSSLDDARFVLDLLKRWFHSSKPGSGLVVDLENIIEDTIDGPSQPQPVQETSGLARAVSEYHRLGVHSLLGMSRFGGENRLRSNLVPRQDRLRQTTTDPTPSPASLVAVPTEYFYNDTFDFNTWTRPDEG